MKMLVRCAAFVSLVLFARLIFVTTSVVRAVPGQIDATRAALVGEVQATRTATVKEIDETRGALVAEIDTTRGAALDEIDHQAKGVRLDAAGQITDLRSDVMARIDTLTTDLNGQATAAIGQVAGVRADLKPTLDGAAAMTKDAKDSWDSNYYDVVSLLDSAEVTTTSMAQASEAVRDNAPKMAASVAGITANVDGITKDIHTATSDFVKPKTLGQKLKMYLEDAAYGAHWFF